MVVEPRDGARLFKALGDATRLAILRQLREQGEVCACDFVAGCDVGQPTVSHHLKVLREAGLVRGERRGLWIYYRIEPEGFERVRQLIP
jgi:ArsR family transcriptional regulator